MPGTMTIIKTDGTVVDAPFAEPPGLEILQRAVGGYIETVPHLDTYKGQEAVAYCNEEGKLMGLQPNTEATVLWRDTVGHEIGDILVGDVVIVHGDAEFMEGA